MTSITRDEAADQPNESLFSLIYGDDSCHQTWLIVGWDQARIAAECHPVAVCAIDKRALLTLSAVSGFELLEGKPVLIFPLGDPATDHTVFERSAALGRRCEDEGAISVEFVWLSTNLDTHLGDRAGEERLRRLSTLASRRTGKKPAKAKPKAPSASAQKVEADLAELEANALEEGRPVIDVNDDRLVVLNSLVDALRTGRDGEHIYSFGGQLSHIIQDPDRDSKAVIAEILDDRGLLNHLSRSAQMVSTTQRGVSAAWPETKTLSALYGRHADFLPLRGIAPSPLVRADHSIATVDGYDEASQMLLDLGDLEMEIPEAPTTDEVSDAVALLMDGWLGDFPFANDTDKANMLALILSYPLRELCTLVPLAVISAKSMGTGKSKLVSLVVRLFTGDDPEMDSLPSTEEETRKQITTLLQKALAFLVFDESPEIGGKSINRLLTALKWSDRLLGGNQRASLPNRAVKVATGNNVEVFGDTIRRYYPIELFFDGEDPHDRPETDFRHSDIESWTDEHRSELLTAVFTLIRAWQVAGRPKRATSFGSFERWEAVVGGVIEHAGVLGFLGNLSEHRKSADFEAGLWAAHCDWLATKFPTGQFTTSKVVAAMTDRKNHLVVVRMDVDLPPGIDTSPNDPSYAAKLGKMYHSRQDGWFGGFRITKAPEKAGGNQTKWLIEMSDRVKQERLNNDTAVKRALRTVPELEADLAKEEREHGSDSVIAGNTRIDLEMKRQVDRLESAGWSTTSADAEKQDRSSAIVGRDQTNSAASSPEEVA